MAFHGGSSLRLEFSLAEQSHVLFRGHSDLWRSLCQLHLTLLRPPSVELSSLVALKVEPIDPERSPVLLVFPGGAPTSSTFVVARLLAPKQGEKWERWVWDLPQRFVPTGQSALSVVTFPSGDPHCIWIGSLHLLDSNTALSSAEQAAWKSCAPKASAVSLSSGSLYDGRTQLDVVVTWEHLRQFEDGNVDVFTCSPSKKWDFLGRTASSRCRFACAGVSIGEQILLRFYDHFGQIRSEASVAVCSSQREARST